MLWRDCAIDRAFADPTQNYGRRWVLGPKSRQRAILISTHERLKMTVHGYRDKTPLSPDLTSLQNVSTQ